MTRRRKTLTPSKGAITLGPVLYNWEPEVWRDYYFRIADEAPVDTVVVGEVVCSKREPFFAPHVEPVLERLKRAGKEILLATLALPTNRRESKSIRDLAAEDDCIVEANDVSALALLGAKTHDVGPFVNVYNEGTLAWLAARGARRVTLPVELSFEQIAAISAARGKIDLEVFAFGRAPLALSARCYSARATGLRKDNCQFVCAGIGNGTELATLEGQSFLALNGTTTMSSTWVNLARHIPALKRAGIHRFRLSPQLIDMVEVASIFRRVLDGGDTKKAMRELSLLAPHAVFSDGFHRAIAGAAPVAA